MTEKELEFYQNLIPVLTQAEWQATGAEAYGFVWWWLDCGDFAYDTSVGTISVKTRIGILVLPNRIKFFVRIDTTDYPRQSFTADLASPHQTATIDSLLKEAHATASNLVQANAATIKRVREEWLADIEPSQNAGKN